MMRNFAAVRILIIFSLIVPLAIYIGYLLSNPYNTRSLGIVVLTFGLIMSPLLLKDHHVLPFMFWNATMNFWFLPGSPPFWLLFSMMSVGLMFLSGSLRRRNELMPVPSIGLPLILLFLVIGVTAELRGGIGGEAVGSENFGGKSYMLLFGAIFGFFALSSHQIPLNRVKWYIAVFFLSSVSAAISDLILAAGPSFYFLYSLVSPDIAMYQAEGELGFGQHLIRLAGASVAGAGICHYLLARYGIRGMLELRRWGFALLFLLAFGIALLGGFRTSAVTIALLVVFQFIFEKLLRTGYFPAALLAMALLSACVLPFLDRMPLSIQRSLSFLPVRIDPEARYDAEGTSEWRLEMWKKVLPDVPAYLLLGKGFTFNGTDLYLTAEATKRGYVANYEGSIINGAYHNGPLTTIIPFGIWGALGFLWFCWTSIRYLYRKKEHGHPALKTVNTFLLSFFCSSLVFFLTIYGQFNLDLYGFVGIIGFAIALNRGAENPKLSPRLLRTKSAVLPAGLATQPVVELPLPA